MHYNKQRREWISDRHPYVAAKHNAELATSVGLGLLLIVIAILASIVFGGV